MYPKQHAIISGLATLLIAVFIEPDPVMIGIWTLIGTVAGVFIDVDHAVLSVLVENKWKEVLYWCRHPVKALTEPESFIQSTGYDTLVFHRLASHILILLTLVVLLRLHPFVLPAVVGVSAHIAADMVWDVKNNEYIMHR